jgi:type IV pilus assembly protein PilQ
VVSQGEVKFLDTGTKLSFRPYISDDGYIRMDIHPKDSSGALNSDKVPDETSAELVTNVIVKDGQTIVIGGLFRDKVSSTKTQIPLLGDIPFIGVAFRGKTDTTERQEVIVLLTPHIITDAVQTEGLARVEDMQRKRFGAKEGIQWTSRTRLAEDHYSKAAKYYIEGDKAGAMKELDSSLQLRPTYLEAIRLKERITGDKSPEDAAKIERNIVSVVEQKDQDKWLRR